MINVKTQGNFVNVVDKNIDDCLIFYLNKMFESTHFRVNHNRKAVTIKNPKIEDIKPAVNYVMGIGQ